MAGEAEGVPEAEARGYVSATYGALAGGLRGDADLDALASEVATPGGLNEQFERDLRDAGVYDGVERALAAVLARMRGSTADGPVAANWNTF